MAAATTAMQQRNGNATEMVMDGDGRCIGNATATTAMEGTTATRWQRDVGMMATQQRHDGNATAMEGDNDDDE